MKTFMIQLAKEMGEISTKYFANLKDHQIKTKHNEVYDPVTIADLEISKHIKKRIKEEFGDTINILSEESISEFKKDNRPLFIIDELDGTRRFSKGDKTFCHMIAYYDGEIKESVIYAPLLNILHYAKKGEGAYTNKIKQQIRTTSSFSKETPGWFSTYPYWPKEFYEEFGKEYNIIKKLQDEHKNLHLTYKGSAGLAIPELTTDIDFIVFARTANWDYAAPSLFIREAGGECYLFSGEKWAPQFEEPEKYYPAIFTNGHIDKELLEKIQKL